MIGKPGQDIQQKCAGILEKYKVAALRCSANVEDLYASYDAP